MNLCKLGSQEISGLVVAEYDTETQKNINYLIDYSKFLIKSKKLDESILKWQAENKDILKPLGLDYIGLKKVNISLPRN